MTEQELLEKIDAFHPTTDAQRNAIVCALVGHSDIQTACFGYFYCGRCGAQVGDNLGSIYDSSKVVIIGHNCPRCRANYEVLGWEHKVFVADPFEA